MMRMWLVGDDHRGDDADSAIVKRATLRATAGKPNPEPQVPSPESRAPTFALRAPAGKPSAEPGAKRLAPTVGRGRS